LVCAAPTTINAANKFAYAANLGWMEWRGAEFELGISPSVCSDQPKPN